MITDPASHISVEALGRGFDIGDALRQHVDTEIRESIAKYFQRGAQARIAFTHAGRGYHCDCGVHLDSGVYLHSAAEAIDIYASFSATLARIDKRLRRYKRQLKDRSGMSKVDQNFFDIVSEPTPASDDHHKTEAEPPSAPAIIAEKLDHLEVQTVAEAALKMDLEDIPILFFKTISDGAPQAVYQRKDGHIGWIDFNRTKSN